LSCLAIPVLLPEGDHSERRVRADSGWAIRKAERAGRCRGSGAIANAEVPDPPVKKPTGSSLVDSAVE